MVFNELSELHDSLKRGNKNELMNWNPKEDSEIHQYYLFDGADPSYQNSSNQELNDFYDMLESIAYSKTDGIKRTLKKGIEIGGKIEVYLFYEKTFTKSRVYVGILVNIDGVNQRKYLINRVSNTRLINFLTLVLEYIEKVDTWVIRQDLPNEKILQPLEEPCEEHLEEPIGEAIAQDDLFFKSFIASKYNRLDHLLEESIYSKETIWLILFSHLSNNLDLKQICSALNISEENLQSRISKLKEARFIDVEHKDNEKIKLTLLDQGAKELESFKLLFDQQEFLSDLFAMQKNEKNEEDQEKVKALSDEVEKLKEQLERHERHVEHLENMLVSKQKQEKILGALDEIAKEERDLLNEIKAHLNKI